MTAHPTFTGFAVSGAFAFSIADHGKRSNLSANRQQNTGFAASGTGPKSASGTALPSFALGLLKMVYHHSPASDRCRCVTHDDPAATEITSAGFTSSHQTVFNGQLTRIITFRGVSPMLIPYYAHADRNRKTALYTMTGDPSTNGITSANNYPPRPLEL